MVKKGRPARVYSEKIAPEIETISRMVADGIRQSDIARTVGVSLSTLQHFLTLGRTGEHPYAELSKAWAAASRTPVERVEEALYRSALGYSARVVKHIKVRRVEYRDGKKWKEWDEPVEVVDEIHVPSNVAAQIFYLCNRSPEAWKQRRDDVSSVPAGGIVILPPVEIEKDAVMESEDAETIKTGGGEE